MKYIILKKRYLSIKHPELYLLLGFGIILFILYLSLLRVKNKMAENLLSEKMDLVELNMNDFFSYVEKAVLISYKRGKAGTFQNLDLKEMNREFVPVLDGFDGISGIGLSDENGNYYFLEQNEELYENLIVENGSRTKKPLKYKWSNCNGNLNLVRKDSLDLTYDSRLRPWYRGAVKSQIETLFWTKPYQFVTSHKPGITVSKSYTNIVGIEQVIAFDISILNISKWTSHIKISKHGKAFIVTEDGRFLGLPKDDRFESQKDHLSYLLKDVSTLDIPEIAAAKREVLSDPLIKKLYTFQFNREDYLLKVQPFILGDNTFQICILMPEKDLTNNIQNILWFVILLLFVLILMGILVLKVYQSKRKAYQLLSSQKQELEEKNIEINDSIRYAKHLQEAILPSCSMIKNLFSQSFVFYKPRDIVSGDFYWKHSFDSMVYFAVADCTGHGVPGAMVSVVCANALNRVIKEYGVIEPGKILDHVKEQVVDAFSQSDQSVSDGMDIAICCIDREMNKLWYSGANNSLYKVSQLNNGCEIPKKAVSDKNRILYEYPSTRQPIGKVNESKCFETHEIGLSKGDCIYLFSDGFADQFGGPKGKKYKSKPFKSFLLSISEKPMGEQKSQLENEFETWKGDEEQVDDICILGVRI